MKTLFTEEGRQRLRESRGPVVRFGRMGKADSEGTRSGDISLDGKRIGELLSGQGLKYSTRKQDYVPSGKVIVYNAEIRAHGKTYDEEFDIDAFHGSAKAALSAIKKWVIDTVRGAA